MLDSTEEAIGGVLARLTPTPTRRMLRSTDQFVRLVDALLGASRAVTAVAGALEIVEEKDVGSNFR